MIFELCESISSRFLTRGFLALQPCRPGSFHQKRLAALARLSPEVAWPQWPKIRRRCGDSEKLKPFHNSKRNYRTERRPPTKL